MKKLLFLVLLSFSFSNGYSAYLVNIPQTLKQPDGSVFHCFASGDEFYSWLHDSLGYTIVENPQTGYYVYALPGANGQITASDYIVGIADPVALGLPLRVSVSEEIIRAKRAEFEASTPKIPTHKAGSNKGVINNIVIFVRFADESYFSKDFSYMETAFNDSSSLSANSMYNFFKLASYGQLYVNTHFYPAPSGNVIVSYQDVNPRSYFQPYHQTNNPNGFIYDRASREHALMERAIQAVADDIPSTLDLDYDGDGRVDNICFMITGDPIAGGEILWPHRWSLSSRTVYLHGKRIYDYNLNLANINGNNTSAGVITHEMMHTFGAPDLYRYGDQAIQPVGNWDLMASTNYTRAQGLGAYMKYKYGQWIPALPEITAPGTYTLYPVNDSTLIFDPQKPIGYIINPPDSQNEFLVLEYRKTNACTFENILSGSGILIYRINKKMGGNASADGDYVYDEVHIFRPGGKKLISTNDNGDISKAHFSADVGRTYFSPETSAYPFFCNGDTIKNVSISNITAVGDSIQFTFSPKWESLGISKERIDFEYTSGNTETISITSNVSWTITGVDTSWLHVTVLSGDSGITNIQLATLTQNDLQVPKTCTLTVQYSTKEKYIIISQGISFPASCQGVNNQYDKDTLSGYNFQQYGVNAVSEYFAAASEMRVIDSVSFYFGDINLIESSDNTIKLEIYTSNASNRPGTTLLSQTVSAQNFKPNAWNTIRLQEPIVTSKGITVGYSFATMDSNFLKINIFKNAQLRTGIYNGTMFVRQNGTWKKPSEVSFPEIMNYSLAMKLVVCPPSPATDTLLVSATNLPLSYDSNVQINFSITSNTSWEILNLPEGYSINQSNGTGDKTLIITTLTKHRETKKVYTFLVRSGSIIHRMTIERATHPLVSNKKEVELNYEGTDSAVVYITAIGTSWEAQTDCDWLRLPITTGSAGVQKLVIYPTGENNTNAAFEGCVNIVSELLNESNCIFVRQKSIVGIQQAADAAVFSLYPNPATSQLFVNNGNIPMQIITVYDVVGKEVLTIFDLNSSYTELNIADLQAGLYFVKVISAENTRVKKFVKNL